VIRLIPFVALLLNLLPIISIHAQHKKLEKQVAEAKKKAAEQAPRPMAEIGKPLPPFKVISANNFLFQSGDLEKGKPIILVLFNPNCDHCRVAATKLVDKVDDLKQSLLFFVTGPNLQSELGTFVATTGLIDMDHIMMSADLFNMTDSLFESKGIPQIMLYNREHILIHKQYSELNMDSLMHYVNQL
jgi:hypothetical protein